MSQLKNILKILVWEIIISSIFLFALFIKNKLPEIFLPSLIFTFILWVLVGMIVWFIIWFEMENEIKKFF